MGSSKTHKPVFILIAPATQILSGSVTLLLSRCKECFTEGFNCSPNSKILQESKSQILWKSRIKMVKMKPNLAQYICIVLPSLLAIAKSVSGSGHLNGSDFVNTVLRPGPEYIPTRGEPWPRPQLRRLYNDTFMILRPAVFRFQVKVIAIN